MDQQGLIQVLLYNCSPTSATAGELLYFLSNFIQRAGDLNSGASVRILTRFNDPNVSVILLLEQIVGPGELDVL